MTTCGRQVARDWGVCAKTFKVHYQIPTVSSVSLFLASRAAHLVDNLAISPATLVNSFCCFPQKMPKLYAGSHHPAHRPHFAASASALTVVPRQGCFSSITCQRDLSPTYFMSFFPFCMLFPLLDPLVPVSRFRLVSFFGAFT